MQFKKKMKQAAEENAKYQEASKMTSSQMRQARDSENCFRVGEIGIASGAVTVLGKPVYTQKGITIVPPPPTKSIDDPRFMFRILRGKTVDNLERHRMGSLRVYLGFAAMGACTVYAGEERIRDSVEVTYT